MNAVALSPQPVASALRLQKPPVCSQGPSWSHSHAGPFPPTPRLTIMLRMPEPAWGPTYMHPQSPAQGTPLGGGSPAPAPKSGCETPCWTVWPRPITAPTPQSCNTRNCSNKESEASSEGGLPGAEAAPLAHPMTLGKSLPSHVACAQSPGPS